MKYSASNPPLVCMQTTSRCYKNTRKMNIVGVLWHDTGANNPALKRYVQPSDNACDREEMLAILGKNPYKNDWNHTDRKAGMNCWIGKLADGTVTTVQSMPWDFRPWGCGSGKKGSCNDGWIQFEICEDGKNDPDYFHKVYQEACEITAFLCKLFSIDPHGSVMLNGISVPTILCHQDSYKLGLGSNHSDIYDWFPKYGKDMVTARDDVAALLAADDPPANTAPGLEPVITVPVDTIITDEQKIWNTLFSFIGNKYGTAGLMGNLFAESALHSTNLQGAYEKKLNTTDAKYTAVVDSGAYDNFVHDGAGYGLAQWTYWSRKEALLKFAQDAGKSIGDLDLQLDFLKEEISKYTAVMNVLQSAICVREASDAVLLHYEKPNDVSEVAQVRRAEYGQKFFDKYAGTLDSIQDSQPVPAEDDQPKETPIPLPTKVIIVSATGKVNIRMGNGTQYPRISLVESGTVFDWVATAQNGWHAVIIDGQVGWVSGNYSKIA